MTALAQAWWGWVFPAALQATPLLLLAACLDLLMPRFSAPQWRAGVWILAAGKLLLPFVPIAPWGLIPPLDVSPASLSLPMPSWAWGVPVLWLSGIVLLSLGSAFHVRQRLREWHDGAVPVDPGIRTALHSVAHSLRTSAPKLVQTTALQGPVLFGIPKPTLYWPAGLSLALEAEEQRQVLRHELMHQKRLDVLREFAWCCLLVVFWFHPLVWWAVRRMRAIREQCCDRQVAAQAGHSNEAYVSALLKVAARAMEEPAYPGVPLVDPRATLTHRIALLRDASSKQLRVPRTLGATLCLALVLATWPLASWAEKRSATVTEWITRPPGSMQLRFLVLERLAQEKDK